jgi:hypothetical protein
MDSKSLLVKPILTLTQAAEESPDLGSSLTKPKQSSGTFASMSLDEEALEPPDGYYVADCPNPAESGTLSCPYIGCDGFVFTSVEEC